MRRAIFQILVIIFAVLAFGASVFSTSPEKENAIKETEMKYANDPVMLYQTVGIKDCGEYTSRNKGERSGAVRLYGKDLTKAKNFLEGKFLDDYPALEIEAVLYVNAPEATEDRLGQPALLPLAREGGIYCALGIAGSYGVEPFVGFRKKYQEQIE